MKPIPNMPPTPNHPPTDPIPILTFDLADQRYGLLIEEVVEVQAMVEVKPILDAPPEIVGLINRRGNVLPLLDLRLIFRQPAAPVTSASFFIIAEHHHKPVALLVDAVHRVEYGDSLALEETLASGKYIRGMINIRSQWIPVIALESLMTGFLASRPG